MPDAGLVHQVNVNGPGTHLIAIGIGYYHHLPGGSGTTTKHHLGLGELSSPPISARAVASWFIEKFDCTERPLASVSLVISEKMPQPFENPLTGQKFETLPSGTIEELKTALRQWITRAETDSRNSIILYFCGHGLSAGVQNYYLMRDYGEDNEDPLFGAINFRNFLCGLGTKKPSYQFLLFDACRSSNPMIELNRDGGQSIFVADPAGRLGVAETLQQCPIFATELDRASLGFPDQPSLCARAFIRVMDGASCRKEEGNWYVTTHRIVEALSDFQNREASKGDRVQSADANNFAKFRLRRLKMIPRIPVFVRLNDPEKGKLVKITAARANHPAQCVSDPAAPNFVTAGEFEAALEIGEYDFKAERIDVAAPACVVSDVVVMPTYVDVELQV
jgi:Caspase domain